MYLEALYVPPELFEMATIYSINASRWKETWIDAWTQIEFAALLLIIIANTTTGYNTKMPQ